MSLQQLLGIDRPLIQAPMAGVQGSELAIAVSGTGALGSLPCAMLSLEAMQKEFERIRSQTRKPFNQAMAELLCHYKPEVVSFHFGLPTPQLLDLVKGYGAKVLSSATTVQEALWLQDHGVDAVIAQGLEAGGHRGMFLSEDLASQVSLDTLLADLLATLRIPVIAAGGIASVKAALDRGAAAVQVGTAYLLCPEATTSAVHRAALRSSAAHDTALTNVFTGRPARGIVNRMVRELGPMNLHAPQFPLAATASLPLRQKAESQGSGDFSPLWAGQNTAGCQPIPAAQLTQALLALI